MICCGEDHETPFCPTCGKNLRPARPLDELLGHIRKTVRVNEKQTERYRGYLAKDEDDSPPTRISRSKRMLERSEALLAKWTRWRDALSAVIPAMEDTTE